MSRPKSISMPTQSQIDQALAAARKFRPGAYVKKVGPDGVEIGYLGDAQDAADLSAKPFSAAA